MSWLQLQMDTHPQQVEALEDLMLAAGAVAVTLQDNADEPVLEPAVGETPLWQQTRLTGLYRADIDIDTLLAAFPAEVLAAANHRLEILEDKDWEREWIKHYQPMRFGQRLWVCPSWIDPPEPDAVNLLLDPGLAFGTGTHPTTALCLAEIDGLNVGNIDAVDYGCGSGILAVAALKLGARQVLGVDNDPQALAATQDNAQRNALADERLPVALPQDVDRTAWQARAELVIANILAGPLLELAPTLLGFLKPGGTLLLSGLLRTQADELCAHYLPHINLHIAGEKDDWVCLRGTLPK